MPASPEEIGTLPRYTLPVELDDACDRLSGDMHVSGPNTSRNAWPDLVFYLYPNTPQHQGMIAVSQVAMDGQPVVAEMIEDGTGLRVVLPAHLPPGQEVEVAMRFNVTLPVVRTATRCLGGRMTSSACPASTLPWPCMRIHQ